MGKSFGHAPGDHAGGATAHAAAVIVGLALFATPFVRYGLGGSHDGAAHMEHGPRHGGQLLMVRNHHVELVTRGAEVEVYVSDFERRPVRKAHGEVVVDGRARSPLVWKKYRLVGAAPPPGARADYTLRTPDGGTVSFRYP